MALDQAWDLPQQWGLTLRSTGLMRATISAEPDKEKRKNVLPAGSVQRHQHVPQMPTAHVGVDRRIEASSDPSMLGRLGTFISVAFLVWLGWTVDHGKYYTPRSGLGFYLGVVGTLMMLALLAYPLRKHVPWMQRWGALKHWFRVHMILGIIGPTLVLFHSTFHIRSMNAAVALFSMVFVVGSGIIGRFVYTQIHYGLYGRRAILGKLQEALRSQADATKSRLHFAPQVDQWVQGFERYAKEGERSFLTNLLRVPTLALRRRYVEFRCARQLRWIRRHDQSPSVRRIVSDVLAFIPAYLKEVQRVAQFGMYERLFSLWHVLHIPLIYILAASTMFHVIAVYMY